MRGKRILGGHDSHRGGIDSESGLTSLARDLQSSLYLIARHAEIDNPNSLKNILYQAETSMLLIDSYLLATQTERGQLKLDLSPIAVGSVMHDAKYSLRRVIADKSMPIHLQATVNQPVMTHAESLRSMLVATGMTVSSMGKSAQNPLVIRSFLTANGQVGVGSFMKGLSIKPADLIGVLSDESARVGLPKLSTSSGVSLKIADSLCRALGGSLEVKRLGSFCGFATILPRSDQLAIL